MSYNPNIYEIVWEWIGSKKKLQERPIFQCKIDGFRLSFPFNQFMEMNHQKYREFFFEILHQLIDGFSH